MAIKAELPGPDRIRDKFARFAYSGLDESSPYIFIFVVMGSVMGSGLAVVK